MSYTNRNILVKMIRVQDIVLEHKKRGVTQRYVFENIIKEQFVISYSTFNRWLSYPAKQELRKVDKKAPDNQWQSGLSVEKK